jgi:hypothetical protein
MSPLANRVRLVLGLLPPRRRKVKNLLINEIFQIDEVMPLLQQAWTWLLDQVWLWIVVAAVIFLVVGRRSPAQKNLDRHDPFSGGW